MDYSFFALLLLTLSVCLLVAEVFLPSGGALALGVAATWGASMYCAYQAWWELSPNLFTGFIILSVVILPTTGLVSLYILPRTSFGKRVLLEGPKLSEVTPFQEEEQKLRQLIGHRGTTLTPLTPGGLVEVEGQRLHCYSYGMSLDRNTLVEVVKVSGTRVLVAEASNEPKDLATPESPADRPNTSDVAESAPRQTTSTPAWPVEETDTAEENNTPGENNTAEETDKKEAKQELSGLDFELPDTE